MRAFILTVMVALLGAGSMPADSDGLLITGISIVRPETTELTAPSDVLIRGGRIVEVAAAGSIPRESAATVFPADGLYAMPGLIDVHTHQGDGGLGQLSDTDRDAVMRQFLRYGVTTILNLGGGGGTEEELARWKERCGLGELECPDVYGTGVILTAPGGHPISTLWGFPPDTEPQVVYERGARAVAEGQDVEPLIRRKDEMGVDAVKIVIEDWDPGDPKPRLSAATVAELARASHAGGLRILAHVSRAEHVADAVDGGVDGVVHSAEDRLPPALLAQMAERGVFYVPTLSLYDGFFDRARGLVGNEHEPYALAGISRRALESLAAFSNSPFSAAEADVTEAILRDNLRRAAAAAVPLALGTDVDNPSVFPGYSAHEELELMVEAGLEPSRALAAATTGGARLLGREHDLGRIAPGYEADLLILRANPLKDILNTRSIYAVVHDGRVLDDVVSAYDAEPVSTVAEFEPQEVIWINWTEEPCLGGPPFGYSVIEIAEALAPHVRLRLQVNSDPEARDLEAKLAARGLTADRVEVFVAAVYGGMIRDLGPAFVRRADGGLGVVDFYWNNYGLRPDGHPRTLVAEAADRTWAARLGLPVVSRSRLASEGGAREVNGRGTMLLVEAVELHRNPGWTLASIEAEYKRHLGLEKIVWLEQGLWEEEITARLPGGYYTYGTGGHIDTVARFADPSTILLAEITPEESVQSPIAAETYRRMEENLRRLRAATDQDGRPFRIVRMPAADLAVHTMSSEELGSERLFFAELEPGEPLTYILGSSYLNGIVANGVVIVPKFWRPGGPESTRLKDERAAEIYRELHPGFEIVQVDMTALAHCGGGFHCGSLHQPAAAEQGGS